MSDEENHNFIPDDLSNYKLVRGGDLVINKMKAWQGSLGISPQDGIVSPAYYVFEFSISDRRFGHMLLRSKPYVAFFGQVSDGVRIGQWDLSINGMKRIPIVIPSLVEQSAIVRYIEYIDQRIHCYIRAKQKLIKLLEEQKQAIINQAVTRGLDPNAKLKPSGVEWLGEVPEHWNIVRLGRLVQITTGFPSSQIEDKIQEDPYRFLICADKFQTGYDEPLLHTMYVDKTLSGIKAVQTLSRLNRAHPKKHDVFVLDFINDTDTIRDAFSDYYRTTVLSDETDPNKLHDLKSDLDSYQVYAPEHIEQLVELYLAGADRDKLDPILDTCVAIYKEQLDEDGQVDFKGKAKAFNRTYDFLASVLPYTNAEWEKLSIFLNFLVPKLPAPREEDLSKGILEAIDMDSYRVEKQAVVEIQLPDSDAEIEPIPTKGGEFKPEPELDRLSNILKIFNDQFGNIPWTDDDRIRKLISEEIPAKVAADIAYQNAKKNSDKQNARIEHDKALERVMTALLKDDTQLFKQFSDNESFRRWLTDTIFSLTYSE